MLRAASNPTVLPATFSTWSLTLEELSEVDPQALLPNVSLPESLRRAAPRRQLAFLAGRYCAQRAVASCTLAADVGTLATGAGGAPVWPRGFVGSITHTRGFASATVAPVSIATGVGIDTEEIMSLSQADDVRPYIVTREELGDGVQRQARAPEEALTLAFSAKESVYKCLYPLVGCYFDYLDARVTFGTDPTDSQRGTFRAVLLIDLSPEFTSGAELEGRFQVDGRFVHTGVALLRAPVQGAESCP